MLFSHFLARAKKSHDRGHPLGYAATSPRTAAMEPKSGKRIKISNEEDFNSLLGALIRELPDVFEAEVLTKLSFKDHLTLAQVNKECKDVVYKIEPLQFLRNKCIGFHNGFPPTMVSGDIIFTLLLQEAADIGRLDVLKWLWEREPSRRGGNGGVGTISTYILEMMKAAAEILRQGRRTEAEVPA